jgi:plastocyanin
MNRTLIISLALLGSAAASGQTLTGSIDDPSLRRKTDLVYVEKVDGAQPPPSTAPVINQKNNTYLPHILAVVAGTRVELRSEDPELHNVFARAGAKVAFNQAVLPMQKFDRVMNEPGVVHLTCNIHKEMSAWIVVLQNGYFTRPDPKTGAFRIEGLKPGTYTVRIWGEALSPEQLAKKFTAEVRPGAQPIKVANR